MIEYFLNNLWRWKCGIKEITLNSKLDDNILGHFHRNWSPLFEKLMRNRLTMGAFRYGPLYKQVKGKYNNLKSIADRLARYKKTGNDEILVDIANLCMVEFVNGVHPKKHFKVEDDGQHTEEN